MNDGGASAEEMIALIKRVRDRVRESNGHILEPESLSWEIMEGVFILNKEANEEEASITILAGGTDPKKCPFQQAWP